METLTISVSNQEHLIYLPGLVTLIAQEAEKNNMLAWAEKELAGQIVKSNAIIALLDGQLIGYVGLIGWKAYVEICALIVEPEYRGQGIGSNLVRKAIELALAKFPSK
ncbi:MAG: GNAT family N-acetyltransferase [Candidatus Parcubacteria bacterium]|nr:GNAT family N-acetyltransferase [Candidatus Parcubacteria bacterium]